MGDLPLEEVIFQGAKPYWRTRNTLDVMLVEHRKFNMIELITYDPTLDKESPRIYLDNTILNSKLDQADIDARLLVVKEPFIRRREVPDSAKLLKDIINRAKADYVLNRLFISEYSLEKKHITVEIQFNFRDRDDELHTGTDVGLLVCQKPSLLQRYKSPHHHTLL